jgi:hypothetical protein
MEPCLNQLSVQVLIVEDSDHADPPLLLENDHVLVPLEILGPTPSTSSSACETSKAHSGVLLYSWMSPPKMSRRTRRAPAVLRAPSTIRTLGRLELQTAVRPVSVVVEGVVASRRSDSVGFRVYLWCHTALLVELREGGGGPATVPRRSRERPGNVASR